MMAGRWYCACTGENEGKHEDRLCPAGIVVDLAGDDCPEHQQMDCWFCGVNTVFPDSRNDVDHHDPTCAWRRAKESVPRNLL